MKKLLLILFLIPFSYSLFSQAYSYHPFPVDTGYWQYRYYDDFHNPTPDGTDYIMSGDTIISGVNYKKITSPFLSGAIRESNKTIYFYPDTASQEYLIYNFNLQAGDFIYNTYGSFPNDTFYVDYIDTVLLVDGYHSQWHLGPFITWIDGIGSTTFLLNSTSSAPISGHDVLEYMEGDSIIVYNNIILPPPPPPDCIAFYSTSFDSLTNTFNLTVPTPVMGMISSYLWNFGDGTTSTLASPTHFYPIDSLYNVCMNVVSYTGDTCSYCHIIGKDTLGNIIRNGGFSINVNATGIPENKSEDKVIVYPNPSNGKVKIQLAEAMTKGNIKVFNITGQLILEDKDLNGNFIELNIMNQDPGIYFIEILNSDKVFRSKIIKQ